MPLDARLLTSDPVGTPAWSARPDDQVVLKRGWEPVVGVGADEDPRLPPMQDPTKAILWAQSQVGRPYSGPLSTIGGGRFGDPGYDCSSFVSSAYRELGINLAAFTDTAAQQTRRISNEEARPGDIVFYRYADRSQPGVTYPHMGIYLGNGQMIDAGFNTGVSVRPLLNLPYEFRRHASVAPPAVAAAAVDQAQIAAQSPPGAAQPAAAATNPIDAGLARIEQMARGLGYDDEATRIFRSIARIEGGLTGARGPDPGGAYGAFQFSAGGELANFARARGLTLQQAGELLTRDPFAGVEWAMTGYLGRALQAGRERGLSGADLATYVQRYGQRSREPTPERAGAAFLREPLTTTAPDVRSAQPFGPPEPTGSMGHPSGNVFAAPPPAPEPWRPMAAPAGWQQASQAFQRQYGVSELEGDTAVNFPRNPEELAWRESALGMVRAGQPFTFQNNWQDAENRYQQEFGEPLDWTQYAEDPETYGYVESALGMSRAGEMDAAPAPWWEPDQEEEDTGWGQDRRVGAGQDFDRSSGGRVGVGEEWYEWGPFGAIGSAFSGLGTVGNAFSQGFFGTDTTRSLSPWEEEERRRQMEERYGWGTPWDYVGDRWKDATEGQNPLYDVPIIGGPARVAGFAANTALGALDLPYRAAQYGFGVAEGLFEAPTSLGQSPRGGLWREQDFGGLGGVQFAPEPRSVEDIFNPTQAVARFETAVNPFLKTALNLVGADKGFGIAVRAARGGQVARESAGIVQTAEQLGRHLMNVPMRQGLEEDLGHLVAYDLSQLAAQTSLPLLGAVGGAGVGLSMAHDPSDTRENADWGEYARDMLVGAGLGAVGGLLAYKGATIGAKHLTEGATEFRILRYAPDDSEELSTLLWKYHGDEMATADAQGVAHLRERIRATVADAHLPLQQEDVRGGFGTYPYFQSVFNKFRSKATDSFAWMNTIESNMGPLVTTLGDDALRDLGGDESLSGLARVAANAKATAANIMTRMKGNLHRHGIRDEQMTNEFNGRFKGDLLAVDRAVGRMPDDLMEMAETNPELLRELGIEEPLIFDAAQIRTRRADLETRLREAREQSTAGQQLLAPEPLTADTLAQRLQRTWQYGESPEAGRQFLPRSGDEMLSALSPLEDAKLQADEVYQMTRDFLGARVGEQGGLRTRASMVEDIARRTAAQAETEAAREVDLARRIADEKNPLRRDQLQRELETLRSSAVVEAARPALRTEDEVDLLRRISRETDPAERARLQEKLDELDAARARPEEPGGLPLFQSSMPVTEKGGYTRLVENEKFPEPPLVSARPPGFQATGPLNQNLDEAMGNLFTTLKHLENRYGPGTATRWIDAALEEQRRLRPYLEAYEQAGGLAPGTVRKLFRDHSIYAALTEVENHVDRARTLGYREHGLIVDSKAVERAYSTDSLVRTTTASEYQHLEKLISDTATLQVFNRLKAYGARDDWFRERIMRPFVDESGAFKTPSSGDKIPEGWGYYTGLNAGKVETYLVPLEIRDSLLAMSTGEADKLLQMMGRLNQPFRLGVTAASLPFILGNVPRDFQTGIQNAKYPLSFMRNFLTAAMDVAVHGIDQFVEENLNNPFVRDLPTKTHQSFANLLNPMTWDEWMDPLRLRANRALAGGLEQLRETPAVQAAGRAVFGESGPQMRGFLESGSSTAALLPQLTGAPERAAEAYGMPHHGMLAQIPVLGGLGTIVRTPFDLVQQLALSAELTGRVAVYRSMLDHGEDAATAGMAARSVLTDFSKGGQWGKMMGTLFPLVNARLQGSLRSAEAAMDDPEGFATRLAIGAAIPTMFLYAHNRLLYSDLYDGISQFERDKNWIVIYGSLKDDRDPQGKERALYFKIPKNDVTGMVANPLEHLMDAAFHVKHGQIDLAEDQRTERSAGQMWLTQLANMIPISVAPDNLANHSSWWNAFLSSQPMLGTAAQLAANYDIFRNRPIIPDDQMLLPPEYRKDAFGREGPWAARALAKLANDLGLPQGLQLAPPAIAFAVSHLGGTAATMAMYAPDAIWAKFAEAGLPVPDQIRPTSLEDLDIPGDVDPKTYELYINALTQTDIRPDQVKFLSRIFGMGGGQQTVSQKVKALSRQEQQVWEQTTGYFDAIEKARYEINQERAQVRRDPRLTNGQIYEKLDDLANQLVGRQDQAAAKFPLALRDPNARQAFMDNLPGVPINAADFRPANLPETVPVDQLVARYQNPQGVDMMALNGLAQQQARTQELQRMAREFQVPTAVLRDYIAATLLNQKLPTLTVPAVELDELVNRYMRPPGVYDIKDMQEVTLRQRVEIQNAARQWNMDPQEVWERVNTRLVSITDPDPVALSLEHARAVRAKLSDPREFPRFADNAGNPVGMPGEWDQWERELNWWKGAHPGQPAAWPQPIRAAEQARANAEVLRIQALSADPHYYDYQAWFGMGQQMSPRQWQEFISGEMPRYSDRPSTAESARRDGVVRLYNALPQGSPTKGQLRAEALRYKKLQTPGWQQAMLLDDLGNRTSAEAEQRYDDLYAQLF